MLPFSICCITPKFATCCNVYKLHVFQPKSDTAPKMADDASMQVCSVQRVPKKVDNGIQGTRQCVCEHFPPQDVPHLLNSTRGSTTRAIPLIQTQCHVVNTAASQLLYPAALGQVRLLQCLCSSVPGGPVKRGATSTSCLPLSWACNAMVDQRTRAR